MVYLLETELEESKSVFLALKNVYGIGKSRSFFICKQLGFSLNLKINELSDDQIAKLLKLIELSDITITSDLKKLKQIIAKNLVAIKSYRGLRRINGFPVRGQRTHTNAKTAKRNKR
jgi:small subunit ribosomal protein S13